MEQLMQANRNRARSGITYELNAVAKDLGGAREALRLRAVGLQAEAARLARAALSARAAAEQIACMAKQEARGDDG
jgi:hypothetical protein